MKTIKASGRKPVAPGEPHEIVWEQHGMKGEQKVFFSRSMSSARLDCIRVVKGTRMEPTPERIEELIGKYLRDECTDEDRYELLFLFENPGDLRIAETMMDQEALKILHSRLAMDTGVSERILDKLKADIGKQAGRTVPFYRSAFFRIAASFTGLLVLAGLAFLVLSKTEVERITTENGQKRTVVLADGSLVTLNDNSSISFSMTGAARELVLDGEAYFDIAHDAEKPFYVKTSKIQIRVLGTIFNVKSYESEDRVETTLVEGKVTVKNLENEGNEIEMLPNEQVVFHKETAALVKTSTETEQKTAWRSGNFFFEDESAGVIFSELEKWYGVKIILDDGQKDCRFSMNIGEESIANVLGFFEKTTNVKVIDQGNTLRLEGKLCD